MKKVILLFFVFSSNIHGKLPFKPWLAYGYFAGHNDLFGFLNSNLNQLPAGANKNVNILSSYFAFEGCSNPPNSCSIVTTQRYISAPPPTGNFQNGPTIDGQNTSDQSVFQSELSFALSQASSKHLIIFLGGHGNGPDNGCCLDQQNGAYLTDIAIQNGLKTAMQMRGGKKTDILAFDCCYMACIEYFYACANYTNYLIASEEEDPGNGLPYNLCLSLLKKNNISDLNFAKAIVAAFNATYTQISPGGTPQNHFTLAAIDSSKVVSICENVNSVATTFIKLLKSNQQTTLNLINKSISNLTQFPDDKPNGIFVDLKNWYTNLISTAGSNPLFKALIKEVKAGVNLINQAVVANGTNVPNANGITIFMPLFAGKYCCKPSYSQTLFAQAFPNWLTFLTTVHNLQNA